MKEHRRAARRIGGLVIAALLVLGALSWIASRAGMIPAWLTQKEHVLAEKLGLAGAFRRSAAAIALVLHAAGGASAQNAGAVPPTTLGITPTSPIWYNGRVFTNLLLGGSWIMGGRNVKAYPPTADMLDANGNLKRLPSGTSAYWSMTHPVTGPEGTLIRCTYAGRGALTTDRRPYLQDVRNSRNAVTFRWINATAEQRRANVHLIITASDPSDPIRDIDCRETSRPADQRFDPGFVDLIRPFKVLRFMGWQDNNGNAPVTWATRHTPASLDVVTNDRVSVEDMVALANMTKADPWFSIPWNADADYVHRFAQYVHENVPADRHVYVELANEVWNYAFATTKQALREGQERKLSSNDHQSMLFRYAEKTVETMKIWEKVFSDRPKRLVRVFGTQHVNQRVPEMLLTYKDTAKHVDALATAPYFGYELKDQPPGTDIDTIFRLMGPMVGRSIDTAVKNKAVADKFGKRYISYESGQHVVLKDVSMEEQVQRDPRMYEITKHFINGWKERVGDTLMIFGTVFPIRKSGAWGLLEYDGQPASEAPKYRAVMEEAGR